MSPAEIVDAKIQYMLQRRAWKNEKKPGNSKPTIRTADIDDKLNRWWYPKAIKQLNQEEKRLIILICYDISGFFDKEVLSDLLDEIADIYIFDKYGYF